MIPQNNRQLHAPMRKHRPDMLLVLFLSILLLLGVIVIYAISPPLVARAIEDIGPNHFLYRQLGYLAVGIILCVAAYTIPLEFIKKYQGTILIAALVLCLVPFLLQSTPVGLCVNNACRWIDFGFVSFQPAEVLKLALVIFLGGFLAARSQQGKINDKKATLMPVMVILAVVALIIVGLQQDLGTGAAIIAIILAMLFIAGVKLRLLASIIAIIALMGTLFIAIAPHRIERVMTFVNHSSVTDEVLGYHINQALIAIGSGGLTGKGLGQSIQVFGYLPEAANDSIFAIMAEIFGFVGIIAVLAIFAGLLYRILRTMDYSSNTFYMLIAGGIFGWVASHIAVNVGAMLGIFPLTGITLPFVSFGGTSLVFMLMAIGIVLQVSRYTGHQTHVSVTSGGTHEDSRGRRGVGRSRNTGIGGVGRAKTPRS